MVLEEDLASCGKLVSLLKEVIKSAHENEVYFSCGGNFPSSKSNVDENAKSIAHSFLEIRIEIAEGVLPAIKQLYSIAHKYDPCPGIKANGIRCWLLTTEKLAVGLLSISARAAYKRKSFFFRAASLAYKLKVHTDYLRALRSCLDIVVRMGKIGNGSSIICDTNVDPSICMDDVVDVISEMRQIDVAAFCGRTPSFHLCESAQSVCQGILLAFATFSAAYGPVSPLQSAIHSHGGKSNTGKNKTGNRSSSGGAGFLSLLSNPDVLSQQVLWALANFDVGLVKRFWLLGDNPLLLAGADLLIPSVAMSQPINVHSIPISVNTCSGREIMVDPPSSFSGVKPVKARLLSDVVRRGQEYWFRSGVSYAPRTPPTDTIIFQVHGGGFICQSSRAQEIYLRQFACETHVPFFCVDYSLLPEDPFPRAIEEIVFAYCWMLNNFSKLGTTGKRIVAIGDSAGGCLLLSMCLQLIQMDVRVPDSMVLVYPYACSSIAPSPSRLLGLTDPIVPIPILVRCACSYANLSDHDARLVLGIGSPDLKHVSPLFPPPPPPDDGDEDGDCPPPPPETPIPPSSPTTSETTRNNFLFPSSSNHRRSVSMIAQMPTSKSVGSALGQLAESSSSAASGHHSRNKSLGCSCCFASSSCLTADLDFQRKRMSEAERVTLADLMGLPVFCDALFSPLTAPDVLLSRLPPLHLIGSTSDPLLDDSVSLCRRLRALGRPCEFTVVDGVPHGFLNLALVSRACNDSLNRVCQILKQMVGDAEQQQQIVVDSSSILISKAEMKAEFQLSSIIAKSASSIYASTLSVFSALNIFSGSVTMLKRRLFVTTGDGGDDGF